MRVSAALSKERAVLSEEKIEQAETEAADQEEIREEAETEEAAEEPVNPEAEEEQASGPGEKKGFFRKKEKKDKKDEQIAELTDKVKRQLAEFENFRNRTEKEKSQMYTIGARDVVEKILPVVDNFERGLQTPVPEGGSDAFMEGMNMVYKQLMTELENIGVKPIKAIGTEFNPDFHNAVMQVASEEYESGIVAQELQKGYTYHDLVVRHSMVAVTE